MTFDETAHIDMDIMLTDFQVGIRHFLGCSEQKQKH
jgi:hypothetical protein